MSTDRRTLLGAGAALALPAWMARAFGQDAAPGAPRAATDALTLASAERRGRAVGKPLLVIFTDPAGTEEQTAGVVWGELFAHATQEAWLDLALVEVVCLTREAFGKIERPSTRGTRWAAVFETDEKAPGTRFVEGHLSAIPHGGRESDFTKEVRARAAALARLLHDAILPDDGARARRAAQSSGSLSDMRMEDRGRYEAALGPDPAVRCVDLDRFAAAVRQQHTGARLELLAMGARIRLFEQDPPGARWHTGSDWCPPCGMGYVPPASRYFLRFYTQ